MGRISLIRDASGFDGCADDRHPGSGDDGAGGVDHTCGGRDGGRMALPRVGAGVGGVGWMDMETPAVALCALYVGAGILSLFIYLFPDLEGGAALLSLVWEVWQGIVLWRGERSE